jgi:hypothetical protein
MARPSPWIFQRRPRRDISGGTAAVASYSPLTVVALKTEEAPDTNSISSADTNSRWLQA